MAGLSEYFEELAGFDWSEIESDDKQTWRHAFDTVRQLATKAHLSEAHHSLYVQFRNHALHGAPKPTLEGVCG